MKDTPKTRKERVYDHSRNVLEAAKERISMIFDNFQGVQVSISGGKDSTVLWKLVMLEAERRNRAVDVFFLDQEAEYAASIDVVEHQMSHPLAVPLWYQVPIYMTNATSYSEYFLYAWGEGEQWMREKHPMAIKSIDGDYPRRFYEFFPWLEQDKDTAYLVGLRADESLTRYRAVTKHPGWNGLRWSTVSGNANKFYPIYDWGSFDVWRFIHEHGVKYNKIYDLMYQDGYSLYKGMRVSNLIHEKSYKCLEDLPRFEPETYDRLCRRIGGIATAARYASERLVFSNKKLPTHYKSWLDFRDFLLSSIPNPDHLTAFRERFAKQSQDERTYRAQVGQLLINDYENSRSFDTKKSEKALATMEKWRELL